MTLRVGLSGGIGSGKSTVAAQLAELGAVVVDADAVAREVVAPGTPGLARIVEQFGAGLLRADGSLDRPALAALVFTDEHARVELERITHPLIRQRSRVLIDAAACDAIVVHDIPLLVEMGLVGDYALTVIVDVPEQERVRRLVEHRGMTPDAASARVRAQATDEDRARAADVLLANSGSLADLKDRVEHLWGARLRPFEDHLRAGRITAPDDVVACPSGSCGPAAVERSRLRLRAALGEDLLRLRPADPDRDSQHQGDQTIRLRADLRDADLLEQSEVLERLARRGLLVADPDGHRDAATSRVPQSRGPGRWIGSADPAQSLHCDVQAANQRVSDPQS